jgi:sugar/nucleoside kinase (ribokinase family)
MPGTVYALGSILVDLTVDVPALPERGGDRLATATRTKPGGGFNLAAAVARQGIRCVYAGPHGTGPYAEQVRAALAREGIEVATPARAGADTGFCITLVEPDGERTFVTLPGVEAAPDPVELAACRPGVGDIGSISGYDLAYPESGPVLADWVDALAPGPLLALDPGPLVLDIPADRLARVLARTGLFTMNQREARLLAGDSALVGVELLSAVRRGLSLAPDAVLVVREGSAGCVATGGPRGSTVRTVEAPRVAAVDTTGAGDTHTGVLLAALAQDVDLADALALATRAAAMSVTRLGPATAPTAAELS